MSERILLLEDDDDLATITDAVVSSAGYDVVRASSVNDAIAQCESVLPAVALVDVQLPERSGWDFVREAMRWPEMRIVVYTVHHDEPETIEQAARMNVDAVVGKTSDPMRIVDVIRSFDDGPLEKHAKHV
ncbi:MAG: response regulator [Actinobacteria bacterium]|nr:MAG: response regulator [Actinomycetota bacterium]